MSLFFNHAADKNCTNHQIYELKTETVIKIFNIFQKYSLSTFNI